MTLAKNKRMLQTRSILYSSIHMLQVQLYRKNNIIIANYRIIQHYFKINSKTCSILIYSISVYFIRIQFCRIVSSLEK